MEGRKEERKVAGRTIQKRFLRGVGLATPIILIATFLLFPVISVLISGVVDESGLTLTYLGNVFTDGYYYKLFAFTLSQAFLSTLFSVVIGIPIGYIFGKYEFTGRRLLLTMFTVPFVLPSVLVGMGFLGIFGENGLFGIPLLSIILAHGFYNIPLVIQYFSAIYQNFDRDLLEAAKSLGSKGFQTLFRVYIPIFSQAILTAALLTFNFCFLSFGIIIILGQARFRTVETQIFAEVSKSDLNTAAALAIMQLLVTITYVLIYLFFMRSNADNKKAMITSSFPRERIGFKQLFLRTSNNNEQDSEGSFKKSLTRFLKKSVGLFKNKGTYLILVFILGLALELAPMIGILVNSFWDPNSGVFTFQNFWDIFRLEANVYVGISIPRTMLNSLLFAIGSAIVSIILAVVTVLALGKERLSKISVPYEMITYLPLAVSSVTLSLGILNTFINFQFFLNNSWLFIIISHGLLGYPFVTRALLNGLNTIGPEMEEVARTLGASRSFKLRKIYLPLLLPSLAAGLAFAFGLSLGEFTAANFFYLRKSTIATLTVALYRLRAVRQFGSSSAVGTILLLISYGSFFLIEKLSGREQTSAKI